MKISKCKKELARIISENGGWKNSNAEWAAQDVSNGQVSFFKNEKPTYSKTEKEWMAFGDSVHFYGSRIEGCEVIKNFHQTILSSEEYFHLYPAPDAKPRFCESVMRSIPEPTAKPTIEQLAADYRNAKDYADRKQQEADDAKADAEAKLAELVAAGGALGLVLGVADAAPVTTKFTGKFHSAKYGDRPSDLDMICDGCGKRFGHHVGFDCRP